MNEFDVEGDNEQGFLMGAASGAAAGGMAGGVPGAIAGTVIGGYLGYTGANKQRQARKKAEQEAETARRESIVRQMNARMQADSIAMAGLTRRSGASSTSSGPSVNTQAPGGMTGATLTSSGTF